MATKKKRAYKVIFHNEGRVYEIYASSISHGGKVSPLPTPIYAPTKKDS